MQKTQAKRSISEPQSIIIISKYSSRQTAIKALLRTQFPNISIFAAENYSDANQHLCSWNCSRVLVVVDGWSLGDNIFAGNDLLQEHDSTQQDFPDTRCLYLVDHSKNLRIKETDRVLGGDITSNQFIDTIQGMFE